MLVCAHTVHALSSAIWTLGQLQLCECTDVLLNSSAMISQQDCPTLTLLFSQRIKHAATADWHDQLVVVGAVWGTCNFFSSHHAMLSLLHLLCSHCACCSGVICSFKLPQSRSVKAGCWPSRIRMYNSLRRNDLALPYTQHKMSVSISHTQVTQYFHSKVWTKKNLQGEI